jgi:tyrosine-protein phosphatase SIW14
MAPFRILALVLVAGTVLAGPEAPGVSNFHEVDDHVYRGAQPGKQGFASLARLGVRTVVDLRGGRNRSRAEAKAVEAAGMRYVNIPLKAIGAPRDDRVAKVLAVLDDSSAWPVFVHCQFGKDRTGTVVACYRIAHDRWQNRKALDEANSYGMSWIERGMRRYILRYGVHAPARPGLVPQPATQ